MPWRLIFSLIGVTLLVCFVGFNADHTSDISFGFYTFENVRIFISLFVAFMLGALVVIPYTIKGKRKPKEKKKTPEVSKKNQGETKLLSSQEETSLFDKNDKPKKE